MGYPGQLGKSEHPSAQWLCLPADGAGWLAISVQTAVSLSRDSVTLAARNVTLGRLTSSSHNLGGADPANSAVTMLTTEMQLQTAPLFLAPVTIVTIINVGGLGTK